ncbi:MAG: ABC transporter ATP-binding protein [Chloroflexi bacterium]|nr:ABC transporter ATP-binding protein [Chloroflexota bacterium]
MTALAAPAVEATGLAHRYLSDAGDLQALEGVDLALAPGEFVSLVGPSGCGKTTLLRLVAGLLTPTSGRVRVLGRAPAEARAGRAFGLVSQEPGLLPWRSVAGNVRLPLEVTGRRADVDALLRLVGIDRFARYYPHQLSGGMRQRVALARALAHAPAVLLMDEPFGALDELSREQMRLELLRIWEQRRTSVLFVTHSIREAVLLSDRVLVMSDSPGRIVDAVPVALPCPRSEAQEGSEAFTAAAARVRRALEAGA